MSRTVATAPSNCFVYLPDLRVPPAQGAAGITNLDPSIFVNMASKALPPMGYDLDLLSNAFPVAYLSFPGACALFTNTSGWQYMLSNLVLTPTPPATYVTNGTDVTAAFGAQFSALAAIVPSGGPSISDLPFQAAGQVTMVLSNYTGGCGDFQTAITSMSLDGVTVIGALGTMPFHIGVSAAQVSSGRTIVTNCLPGDPTIISGFNVYPVLTVGTDQPLEAQGPVWVQVQPDTGGIQVQTCSPIASVTQDPPPSIALGPGWWPVTITAVDQCGYSNQCFTYVHVEDAAPPIVTCVGDRTVQAGTPWTFDPPTVLAPCSRRRLMATVASRSSPRCGRPPVRATAPPALRR